MATLAETLIQGAMKNVGQDTPDITKSIVAGAELGFRKQQLETQRMQVENQQQLLAAKRDGEAMKEIQVAMKMSPKLRRTYVNQVMKRKGEERGTPYAPEFLQAFSSLDLDPVESTKLVSEYFREMEESFKNGAPTEGLATTRAAVADAIYGGDLTKLIPLEAQQKRAQLQAEAQRAAQTATQNRFETREERSSDQFLQQRLTDVKKSFDSNIKKDRDRLDAADNALTLLQSNQPISDEVVKTQLARLAGEVGNLTEGDLQRFGGSKALVDRAQQMVKTLLTGELSETNKQQLIEIASMFRGVVQKSIAEKAQRDADAASRILGVDKKQVLDILNPGSVTQDKVPIKMTDQEVNNLSALLKSNEELGKLNDEQLLEVLREQAAKRGKNYSDDELKRAIKRAR